MGEEFDRIDEERGNLMSLRDFLKDQGEKDAAEEVERARINICHAVGLLKEFQE